MLRQPRQSALLHARREQEGFAFFRSAEILGPTTAQRRGLIQRMGLLLHLKYAIQIADALAKAHFAGIIHTDLKPSNIMITSDGLVKVLDFGLVKLSEHGTGTEPSTLKRMTKQQLIDRVAQDTELGKAQVETIVDSVLELIAQALRSNERVDLRGFGSFVVKDKKERQGRNPRTGETITIAAKRDAGFRPGKELTESLSQGETAPNAATPS